MSGGKVLLGRPGIVVLSPSLEVLHINRQAHLLISDLVPTTPEAQQPNNRTDVLPPALINLAGEILSVLRSRHEINEKGQFEIRYTANESGKPVLIRGVGVPNGHGVEHARIVLVLTGQAPTTQKINRVSEAGFEGTEFQREPVAQGVPACSLLQRNLAGC
jgi:hypothetical protein